MSDDTFTANVNKVGKRLFFFAAPMYDEFSQAEVLVGMAEFVAIAGGGRPVAGHHQGRPRCCHQRSGSCRTRVFRDDECPGEAGRQTSTRFIASRRLGMTTRPGPRRHWRSYGTDPLPTGTEALDAPGLPVVVPADRVRPLRQGADGQRGARQMGGTGHCATSSPACAMTAAAGLQPRRNCSPASRA
jgi:hypothetical protein